MKIEIEKTTKEEKRIRSIKYNLLEKSIHVLGEDIIISEDDCIVLNGIIEKYIINIDGFKKLK